MTPDEERLEAGRERVLGPDVTEEDRAEFKAASEVVAQARTAQRQAREAAGPPEVAEGDATFRSGGAVS